MSKLISLKSWLFAFVVCLSLATASVANADIVIVFSDGSDFGTDFEVTENTTNTFFVAVMETDDNDELSTDGLVGFGLKANYSATSGVGGEVVAASVDDGFDKTNDNSFSTTELNLAGADFEPNDGIPTGSTIALGQFDFMVTGLGVTEFVFDDYSPFADFVTGEAVELDPIIFAAGRTFQLTITAVPAVVPEPGALAALSCVGLAILSRRRKR